MDAKVLWKMSKLDTERDEVELDGILAESNKLSKDIEMMKNGEKSKAAILKENSFKKESKEII
jgi:seryl-tRNA synthetase